MSRKYREFPYVPLFHLTSPHYTPILSILHWCETFVATDCAKTKVIVYISGHSL